MTPEELSKNYNEILQDKSFRLRFMSQIVGDIGPFIIYPPVALQQMVKAIELDLDTPSNLPEPLLTLDRMGRNIAKQELMTLKAFLSVRPAIVQYLKDNGAERTELIPD